jgi:hypothetical protein
MVCPGKGRGRKGRKCFPVQHIHNVRIVKKRGGGTKLVADVSLRSAKLSVKKGRRSYAMPVRRRRSAKQRSAAARLGRAARACTRKGLKPGTHAMGACIRSMMGGRKAAPKRRRKAARGGKRKGGRRKGRR